MQKQSFKYWGADWYNKVFGKKQENVPSPEQNNYKGIHTEDHQRQSAKKSMADITSSAAKSQRTQLKTEGTEGQTPK